MPPSSSSTRTGRWCARASSMAIASPASPPGDRRRGGGGSGFAAGTHLCPRPQRGDDGAAVAVGTGDGASSGWRCGKEQGAVGMSRHENTVAVVTGGTQGVGLAICRRLVAEGARSLVICGRNAARAHRRRRSWLTLGADCRYVQADMAQPDDCVRVVETALDAYGRVNALVNSAATCSAWRAARHRPGPVGRDHGGQPARRRSSPCSGPCVR